MNIFILKKSLHKQYAYISLRMQIHFIFSDNVCILCLSCNVKQLKTTVNLCNKSRNKNRSHRLWWCPLWSSCLYYYRFLHVSDTRKGLSCIKVAFNNTSAISWWSVLLVEQTDVTRENHPPVVSHWQTLSHNVVSIKPRHERDANSQLYRW